MKNNVAALLIAAGLVVAGTSAFGVEKNAPADTYKTAPADAGGANVPADNSGKNTRDRPGDTLTPGDQSGSPADIAITQAVRKAVVDDPNLSVNAQNVKIITVGGVVTLRGPVKNMDEKASIEAKARKVVGVTKIDNQLEVASE
jgi:hyperosmotically inducible periplasmic protein